MSALGLFYTSRGIDINVDLIIFKNPKKEWRILNIEVLMLSIDTRPCRSNLNCISVVVEVGLGALCSPCPLVAYYRHNF